MEESNGYYNKKLIAERRKNVLFLIPAVILFLFWMILLSYYSDFRGKGLKFALFLSMTGISTAIFGYFRIWKSILGWVTLFAFSLAVVSGALRGLQHEKKNLHDSKERLSLEWTTLSREVEEDEKILEALVYSANKKRIDDLRKGIEDKQEKVRKIREELDARFASLSNNIARKKRFTWGRVFISLSVALPWFLLALIPPVRWGKITFSVAYISLLIAFCFLCHINPIWGNLVFIGAIFITVGVMTYESSPSSSLYEVTREYYYIEDGEKHTFSKIHGLENIEDHTNHLQRLIMRFLLSKDLEYGYAMNRLRISFIVGGTFVIFMTNLTYLAFS